MSRSPSDKNGQPNKNSHPDKDNQSNKISRTNKNNRAVILDEELHLTLGDLCHACQISAEQILALVEEGVLEPQGREPSRWRFPAISIRRVRCTYRLTHDLGLNLAGAALAVELLEEIDQLRARLRRLEQSD